MEWLFDSDVLLDVNLTFVNHHYCSFVAILITVVWSTKHCNHRREFLLLTKPMHFEAIYLNLMSPDNTEEIACFQNFFDWTDTKLKGTQTWLVFNESCSCTIFVIKRIRPQNVTKQPFFCWLCPSVNIHDVLRTLHLRWDSSMNAQIVTSNSDSKRKLVKWFHKQFVDFLIEFFIYLSSKCEFFCHLSGLMISSYHDSLFSVINF